MLHLFYTDVKNLCFPKQDLLWEDHITLLFFLCSEFKPFCRDNLWWRNCEKVVTGSRAVLWCRCSVPAKPKGHSWHDWECDWHSHSSEMLPEKQTLVHQWAEGTVKQEENKNKSLRRYTGSCRGMYSSRSKSARRRTGKIKINWLIVEAIYLHTLSPKS